MASVARPAHRSGARGRSSSVRARFLDRIRLAIGATARPCSSDPGDDQVVSLHVALYLIGHDAAANIRLFTEVPVRRILGTSAVMSSRKSAKVRYDIALRPGGRGIQRGTVRRYSA
jgi:hypothetical protein